MNRLLLIDGSNLLFQMFFGLPEVKVHGKKVVQGTLGFVGGLLKIIRMTSPSHVLVVFDGEHENPRSQLSSDYKSNREDFTDVEADLNPFSQLDDIYSALDYLEIAHMETADCEADDIIAGYCHLFHEEMEIVISSMDSDFLQLICDNVRVLRYHGKNSVICDVGFVQDRFGIESRQYAEYKALVGDSADNIKGIRGFGPKTAGMLLREFGSIQGILSNVELLKRPSLRDAFSQAEQVLDLNMQLIRLNSIDVLPFPLEELEYADLSLSSNVVLQAIGLWDD